ncbi:efflux RND transporter periplasmic adaptor subunit [Campylobacter suis]|uniref:Macrolide export protein MacA n=1 Tax=Campylobacter suis TaxID=2790657 RepID=A0ABM8Q226_9BACT|nr:efflux RND transporter periplasmic adaptor subunit [Campylobacter suis]CAD7286801.1 Macrolide export protein MacA [Campylobacter suis]
MFKKITLLFILIVGSYFAYEKFYKKEQKIEYITQKAAKGTLSKRVQATGEIFATELIDVGAQVGGQIKKLYVKLGDNVKKGDMIAEIDSQTQQNNVDNRRAQLEIYTAQLERAKVALDIAKTQFEREQNLYKNSATSRVEFENTKNSYTTANANIKEIKAQIEQAKIALDTAQIDLGYTKITAPRDGTVVSVQVEEGQTVNANQTTPTIVNIADLSNVKLKMQIAEGDITKISVGTRVEYSILSEPNKKFNTTISSIDPALTTLSDGKYSNKSTSNISSSSSAIYYYAQSIVQNSEGILRIGMTTENALFVDEVKDAIIVPSIAIKNEDKQKFVEILVNGKNVEKRAVTTGISDSLRTQILSGVSEGEAVITSQGTSEEIASLVSKERRGMR